MQNKRNKESKKKVKYDRITLDSQELLDGMIAFFNTLDEDKLGIDEITFLITSEITGKSKKIHLFKDFIEFSEKLTKQKYKENQILSS